MVEYLSVFGLKEVIMCAYTVNNQVNLNAHNVKRTEENIHTKKHSEDQLNYAEYFRLMLWFALLSASIFKRKSTQISNFICRLS